MLNLASHDQRDPDLSRNHGVLDELLDLVVSTEVSTERAAFTTISAAFSRAGKELEGPEFRYTVSPPDPQIHPESSARVSPTTGPKFSEHPGTDAAPKSVEYSQIQERCQVSCYNGALTRENDLPCGQDLVPGSDYCLEHQGEEI